MVTHNLKIKQDYIIQMMSSLSRNVLRSNIFLYLIIVLNKKKNYIVSWNSQYKDSDVDTDLLGSWTCTCKYHSVIHPQICCV